MNMLRTMFHSNPPEDIGTAYDMIDTALASAMFASRTAVHRVLGVSPGGLMFHRDMLLPIPVLADYDLIRQRRQTMIDENARRENSRRTFRDYAEGEVGIAAKPGLIL
jgi:hypothetical protein